MFIAAACGLLAAGASCSDDGDGGGESTDGPCGDLMNRVSDCCAASSVTCYMGYDYSDDDVCRSELDALQGECPGNNSGGSGGVGGSSVQGGGGSGGAVGGAGANPPMGGAPPGACDGPFSHICDEACCKVENTCGFPGTCALVSQLLMVDFTSCTGADAQCTAQCLVDADCAAISSLATQNVDPTISAFLNACP